MTQHPHSHWATKTHVYLPQWKDLACAPSPEIGFGTQMLNSSEVNSASLNAEPTAKLIWYTQDVCCYTDGTLLGAVAAPFLVILRRSSALFICTVSFLNETAVDVCIRRDGGHKTSPRHSKRRIIKFNLLNQGFNLYDL